MTKTLRIHNDELSDEDDNDDEYASQAKAIETKLLELYEIKGQANGWKGFGDFEITVLGKKVKLRGITQKHVEKWQAAAADSLSLETIRCRKLNTMLECDRLESLIQLNSKYAKSSWTPLPNNGKRKWFQRQFP